MNSMLVLTFLFSIIVPSLAFEHSELRCLICQTTIKEIQKEVDKVSDKKIVDVGGYRLDGDGKVNKKRKPLIESELFLTEVMENVCENLNNYAKATTKSTGELVLMNLQDLGAVPSMGEVDFIQDGDLNRSLPHICKGILEEYEDEVLEVFGKRSKTPIEDFCVEKTELCEKETDVDNEIETDRFEL